MKVLALLLGGALSLAFPPLRAQPVDTLKRISDAGTINLGHRESSVPFSYYDNKRNVTGFSHELMLKVVDGIRTELRLPSLTIKLVPVTAQNRLALVQNGNVDLECGSTTHNRERERQVAFSVSFFRIGTRLMTATDSRIRDFPDLAGRRVVVTAATTSERLLRLLNEATGGKFTILVAKDHGESFGLLESGRADAFMMDDALLYGGRAKAEHPEKWVIVGSPMSSEVYGCMMRREDHELKRIVDQALIGMMRSGEAIKLYAKWFQRPIPPRGLNLDWPPSRELLDLYRDPNDRPLD